MVRIGLEPSRFIAATASTASPPTTSVLGTELAALLHRGEHVARAQQQLRGMLRDLLREAGRAGEVRDDVAPDELASYCLHALAAASSMPSKAAVRRLVAVTLTGLRRGD
jgi:hypothetical protein